MPFYFIDIFASGSSTGGVLNLLSPVHYQVVWGCAIDLVLRAICVKTIKGHMMVIHKLHVVGKVVSGLKKKGFQPLLYQKCIFHYSIGSAYSTVQSEVRIPLLHKFSSGMTN